MNVNLHVGKLTIKSYVTLNALSAPKSVCLFMVSLSSIDIVSDVVNLISYTTHFGLIDNNLNCVKHTYHTDSLNIISEVLI